MQEQPRGRGRPKGLPKTGGRKPGVRNKNTTELKEMGLEALREVGGVDYLKKIAIENPNAFMTFIGRILPLQVTGEGGGPVVITWQQ